MFRAAWTVRQFGTNFQYAFITPMQSFADLGAAPAGGNSANGAKFRRYITARESHASIYRTDLSKPLPAGQAPKLAVITR